MFRALTLARAAGLAAAILVGMAPAMAADSAAELGGVDSAVRPGDDFYRHANGMWLSATAVPEGRSSYDTSAMLRDETARRVRGLVEGVAQARTPSRIGDYYAGWMDVAGIEAKGGAPLAGELAAIAALGDRRALSAYLGRTLRLDDGGNTQTDGLFGVWIHQGFHDGGHYAAHLVQGGLGLDRDDYLGAGPDQVAARERYRAHVAAMLTLAGFDQGDARAGRVLALEAAIARTHASRADTDDVFKTDNGWRRADFAAKAPGLDWSAYFEAAGLARNDRFVVWQPSAVTGSAALVGAEPMAAWKDYLAFHLIAHASGVLPRAFRDEAASFRGAAAPDRAQEALEATTRVLGEDIGRLYVARYFSAEDKAAAEAMAQNIRLAFRARIGGLAWMSPQMRTMALAKLATLKVGVGYPDHWIDYAGLEVRRGDAYGNLRRAEAFAYRGALARLSRPVDPGEWAGFYPQQVGAVINFSPNSLQFAAALLQAPYFDAEGDAAGNYGSAGAGMAHEISHTFDPLGSLWDDQGRLGKWWGAEDMARYQAAIAPLAAQYGAYCPAPGLCVNGQQVLGESVGDLAGLLVAHDAYLLSLGGRADVVKDGLTGDQRFFLAYARRWRRVQTDAGLRRQIATDSHAPGEYRADTVRNDDDWVAAFGVGPGDRLWLRPQDRVRIW
ncbi:MAG: family peptidase [Caulobacter sp.]|nr:family peptidase [Caulobacter sp.]